jgi:hypothetical protein
MHLQYDASRVVGAVAYQRHCWAMSVAMSLRLGELSFFISCTVLMDERRRVFVGGGSRKHGLNKYKNEAQNSDNFVATQLQEL